MNIILDKDGEIIEYKTGHAYYLLLLFIPVVGLVLTAIMMMMRKQLRGVGLNYLIFCCGYLIIYTIFSVTLKLLGSSIVLNILALLLVVCSVLMFFIYINYVINANYYSLKARLAEGYSVVNSEEPEAILAVQKATICKLPFWQFTKF